MREGVFLPIHLAAPNLDEKLSRHIHSALLLPVASKKTSMSAVDILTNIVKILIGKDNKIITISSLYHPLPVEKIKQFEKEEKRFLFKQNSIVKTRRFVSRNKIPIIAVTVSLLFVGFIAFSMMAGVSQRLTTEGMPSENVIYAYFHAFSSLDHIFMETILNGADKADLHTAINLMAIIKLRESYERTSGVLVPAGAWKDAGRELPAPDVFGVTDISLEHLAGREEEDMMMYRVDYLLWPLNEGYSLRRRDTITLRRDRRKNWRITEILRTDL
jgi:hypothetical protein